MDLLWDGLREAFGLLVGGDPEVRAIAWRSIEISATATLLSLLAGVPAGVLLALSPFPGRRLVVALVNTGMGLPPVVVGLFISITLWRSGPLGFLELLYTPAAMVLAQVVIAFPIVAGLTLAAVQQLNPNLRLQLLAPGPSRVPAVGGARGGAGRGPGDHRSQRGGKVEPSARPRPARGSRGGRAAFPWREGRAPDAFSAGAPAPHGGRVPGAAALRHDGRAQRCPRPPASRPRRRPGRGRAVARAPRRRAPAPPPRANALGRRGAAGEPRARARARSRGALARRAVRRPRPADAEHPAGGPACDPGRDAHDRGVRAPSPRRGAGARRSCGRADARRGRPAGRPRARVRLPGRRGGRPLRWGRDPASRDGARRRRGARDRPDRRRGSRGRGGGERGPAGARLSPAGGRRARACRCAALERPQSPRGPDHRHRPPRLPRPSRRGLRGADRRRRDAALTGGARPGGRRRGDRVVQGDGGASAAPRVSRRRRRAAPRPGCIDGAGARDYAVRK